MSSKPKVPRRVVTPGMVWNAVRKMGLPAVQIRVQPADATLVNFATIFYATKPIFNRSIVLLGYHVDVVATPVSYRWDFGDGVTHTSTDPGAAYPDQDITHLYERAHITVHPHVDVTYTVRFRVDGGAWRAIQGSLSISGPPTDLRIKEAIPVLTH